MAPGEAALPVGGIVLGFVDVVTVAVQDRVLVTLSASGNEYKVSSHYRK